jgi:hypothetical protein
MSTAFNLLERDYVVSRVNSVFSTNVERVNSLRPRTIYCSNGYLFVVIKKQKCPTWRTLSVEILVCPSTPITLQDSDFTRSVHTKYGGVSLIYSLNGINEIDLFLDRLPSKLPFYSMATPVGDDGPLSVSDFITNLDTGVKTYSTNRLAKHIVTQFRRNATQLSLSM